MARSALVSRGASVQVPGLPISFRKFDALPLIAVSAAFIAFTAAQAQQTGTIPPDPTGEWMVAKGYARIRIVNCDGRIWGVVAWEQSPGVDSKNPDPGQRGRPTLGMPILLGMTQSTKPYQWDGEIYNSQDGRTYTAHIAMTGPDTLRVEGCVLRILCGGENWTRVAPPAPPPSPVPPSRTRAGQPRNGAARGAQQPAKNTHPQKNAENVPQTDAEICEGLVGTPGLPHERRLK